MLEKPRPWWVIWSLIPFGWLTGIGLVHAGARARWPLLIGLAVVFFAITAGAFLTEDDVSAVFSVLGWIAGVGVCLGFAPAWQRRMRSREGVGAARRRLEAREDALELAREEPELAREAGVGRPDLAGANHGGVVDVNAAPVAVLSRLPGVDDALAARIAQMRIEVDGFSSLADMGSVLDLSADLVEDLRGRVVFLPR